MPLAPFITSKLQQEAARRLRFTAKRTMGVAQRLYEGVELGDEGLVGLITYMRTDSTRISADALTEVRGYIEIGAAERQPGVERFGVRVPILRHSAISGENINLHIREKETIFVKINPATVLFLGGSVVKVRLSGGNHPDLITQVWPLNYVVPNAFTVKPLE